CWQSVYLSGVPSFAFRKFYAVFLEFEHPTHGRCLIDTGYGPAMMEATRRFPHRLMRWLTPIPKRQAIFEQGYPRSAGIDPDSIERIFISHFHADHIGSTREFPASTFIYRNASLETLMSLSPMNQMDQAFVPGLLPEDFAERGETIGEERFDLNARFAPFKSIDYWNDGSLTLLDLPGHAIGHTGYLLNTDQGPMLYVVDAFWDRRSWRRGGRLPLVSRRIHHSYSVFLGTQRGITELCQRESLVPLACHCPETQDYV
ncbi:MAG: MBL fold metallo-hydrolase, partial [Planctomycetota bacterium]